MRGRTMDKDIEMLKEMLKHAEMDCHLTINDQESTMKGHCNDAGLIQTAYSLLKIIEEKFTDDFEQALDFMRVIDDMQDVEVDDHLGNLSND
jgi:uncharacterized protein YicC (UPF0701 family)